MSNHSHRGPSEQRLIGACLAPTLAQRHNHSACSSILAHVLPVEAAAGAALKAEECIRWNASGNERKTENDIATRPNERRGLGSPARLTKFYQTFAGSGTGSEGRGITN